MIEARTNGPPVLILQSISELGGLFSLLDHWIEGYVGYVVANLFPDAYDLCNKV